MNTGFIQYGAKVNECNANIDENLHSPACMGRCKRITLSDIDVDLHNESLRWAQAGMRMQGTPMSVLQSGMNVGGIGVEVLQTEVKLNALIKLLEIDEEELMDKEKHLLLEKLQNIRSIIEAEQERQQSVIEVPKLPLYVPEGKDKLH